MPPPAIRTRARIRLRQLALRVLHVLEDLSGSVMRYAVFGPALASLILASQGCGSTDGVGTTSYGGAGGGPAAGGGPPGVGGGTSGTGAIGGVGGGISVDSGTSSGSDANSDGPCQAVSQEVKTEALPVDIIWAVDTSGSMLDEAVAVQENINAPSSGVGTMTTTQRRRGSSRVRRAVTRSRLPSTVASRLRSAVRASPSVFPSSQSVK